MDDIWNIILDLRYQLIVKDHTEKYKHVIDELNKNI